MKVKTLQTKCVLVCKVNSPTTFSRDSVDSLVHSTKTNEPHSHPVIRG